MKMLWAALLFIVPLTVSANHWHGGHHRDRAPGYHHHRHYHDHGGYHGHRNHSRWSTPYQHQPRYDNWPPRTIYRQPSYVHPYYYTPYYDPRGPQYYQTPRSGFHFYYRD